MLYYHSDIIFLQSLPLDRMRHQCMSYNRIQRKHCYYTEPFNTWCNTLNTYNHTFCFLWKNIRNANICSQAKIKKPFICCILQHIIGWCIMGCRHLKSVNLFFKKHVMHVLLSKKYHFNFFLIKIIKHVYVHSLYEFCYGTYIYIYIYIYTTGVSFSIGEAAPNHVL